MAKTDKIDASVIASFAAVIKPAIRPVNDDQALRLKATVSRRRQLSDMVKAETSRGQTLS
ncbi:hypothetical protein V8247_05410 [Candidatus Dehalogenimonas loeffleri]|uniref:Transposase IS110-like N-terminal domain-containing protein n=1 Tax=Candidatus Dehalogenimonas loeffleri TaxID=3127115 RepID=A0ABZ2J6D0_9CHLR